MGKIGPDCDVCEQHGFEGLGRRIGFLGGHAGALSLICPQYRSKSLPAIACTMTGQ